MRKKKLWILLVFAIGTGGLAGFLALNYLQDQVRPVMAAQPERDRIAVAARDLPVGTLLRAEDVRYVDWPGNALPAGYLRSAPEVVGRGVITPLRANEPLLDSKLAEKGSGAGLPIVIPEGKRALSVKVDEVVGVAGFVLAGTRVDVLVTLARRDGQEPLTRVVLQNIPTLAAGQQYQRDQDGEPVTATVVTLLVTPEEAEVLTLAANEGKIQLALRNTLDVEETDTEGARLGALAGTAPSRPSRSGGRSVRVRPSRPAPVRAPTVIETYQGGVRTITTFQNGSE